MTARRSESRLEHSSNSSQTRRPLGRSESVTLLLFPFLYPVSTLNTNMVSP